MNAAGVLQSRAQRFDMTVPAKLRTEADGDWCSGLTQNVSGSGALLMESRELSVGTELEVWLEMHEIRPRIADVVCPSIVVRCEECQPDEFRVGVKFKSYRIQPVVGVVAQPEAAGSEGESARLRARERTNS